MDRAAFARAIAEAKAKQNLIFLVDHTQMYAYKKNIITYYIYSLNFETRVYLLSFIRSE